MWLMCSASPGPGREAVPAGGTPRGAEAMALVPASALGNGGIPFPSSKWGAAGHLCTGSSAAWESRQLWLQVQKFSWVWQNAFPVFLEIWANLWGWGKVRNHSKWEVICLGVEDISMLDLLNYVGFVMRERNQDFLSWKQDEIHLD